LRETAQQKQLAQQSWPAELGIARNTVKNHLRSILARLGVKNRAQAAAYAVSHGLVRLPPEAVGAG